ncbi:MAG: ABC transporter permease [Bryobacteraceae bacterium]|nr:ABC transporter permease [Bryobacteraceae bacterium]
MQTQASSGSASAVEGRLSLAEEFVRDVTLAVRLLWRDPLFTLSVCLTIALGIGASTTMFSVVNTVLLQPLPYPHIDRVVMLFERDVAKGVEKSHVALANYSDWRAQNTVFDLMSYSPLWSGTRSFNVRRPEGNERIASAVVSSELFPMLGVAPQLGRGFGKEDDTDEKVLTVILSDGYWRSRYGGERNVIGQTLTFDNLGLVNATIIGVMPPGFQFPGQTDIWLCGSSLPVPPPNHGDRWAGSRVLEVMARLKPGVSIEQAQAEMSTIAARLARQYPGQVRPEVVVSPLKEELLGHLRTPLLTLLGAVGFVLLIGCVHAANLMLSRGAGRRKEMAIRSALGAEAGRLVRQLLTESVLLSVVAGAVGAAGAWVALRAMSAAPIGLLPRAELIRPDATVLAAAFGLAVACGVLFGLAPALEARRVKLSTVLREGGRTSGAGEGSQGLRHALVVAEVAMALLLLAGAGLLLRSFLKLTAVQPGFSAENSLIVTLDMSSSVFGPENRQQAFFQGLMQSVRALPGVAGAGGASTAPMSDQIGVTGTFQIEGRPPLDSSNFPTAAIYGVTPGFFEALGIPLQAGRLFTEADHREAPYVVLVNEAAARQYWRGEDPVGRRIAFGNRERLDLIPGKSEIRWRPVVGVVRDVRSQGLSREARPEIYIPYWQQAWRSADLVVRGSGETSGLAAAIRREASALNKNVVVERVRTMEEAVAATVAQPRLQAGLLMAFAAAALLLAAIGIFGVMSYTTAQRRHEMALRMALGAQREQILWMVLRQALVLTGLGVAIGLAAAASLKKVLETLVFGIPALDPLTLGAVCLLLAAVAVGSSVAPALRAASVDPMVTLRYE